MRPSRFTWKRPEFRSESGSRELTFALDTPRAWERSQVVTSYGTPMAGVTALAEGRIRFTMAVADGQEVRVSAAENA